MNQRSLSGVMKARFRTETSIVDSLEKASRAMTFGRRWNHDDLNAPPKAGIGEQGPGRQAGTATVSATATGTGVGILGGGRCNDADAALRPRPRPKHTRPKLQNGCAGSNDVDVDIHRVRVPNAGPPLLPEERGSYKLSVDYCSSVALITSLRGTPRGVRDCR